MVATTVAVHILVPGPELREADHELPGRCPGQEVAAADIPDVQRGGATPEA